MTTLEKLCRANRWRIRQTTEVRSPIASSDADGWNGVFLVPLAGEFWQVQISDKLGWKHLSVSNAQKRILPSWIIMCRLKEAFYGDDEWVCQFHPPRDEYVNDHPWVLHLWSPLNDPLPTPPVVLI